MLPIKVYCGASQTGIGAVLLQQGDQGKERPVSFISRTLNETERRYSVIHREALALYWSVNKFSQYLLVRKFTLVSDHKPLLALFGDKKGIPLTAAGRLQRWAVYLSEFDYKLEYINGEKMVQLMVYQDYQSKMSTMTL